MRAWHRFYRAVYHINLALNTGRAWRSGNPRRIARLYERRAAYRLFARIIHRILR